jgi:hypothetical protein
MVVYLVVLVSVLGFMVGDDEHGLKMEEQIAMVN